MRIPVNTEGTAAGRTTLVNTLTGEKPRETAALTSSGSTVRTPVMVFSRIGKVHA